MYLITVNSADHTFRLHETTSMVEPEIETLRKMEKILRDDFHQLKGQTSEPLSDEIYGLFNGLAIQLRESAVKRLDPAADDIDKVTNRIVEMVANHFFMQFSVLPQEIVTKIADYLTPKERQNLALVSRSAWTASKNATENQARDLGYNGPDLIEAKRVTLLHSEFLQFMQTQKGFPGVSLDLMSSDTWFNMLAALFQEKEKYTHLKQHLLHLVSHLTDVNEAGIIATLLKAILHNGTPEDIRILASQVILRAENSSVLIKQALLREWENSAFPICSALLARGGVLEGDTATRYVFKAIEEGKWQAIKILSEANRRVLSQPFDSRSVLTYALERPDLSPLEEAFYQPNLKVLLELIKYGPCPSYLESVALRKLDEGLGDFVEKVRLQKGAIPTYAGTDPKEAAREEELLLKQMQQLRRVVVGIVTMYVVSIEEDFDRIIQSFMDHRRTRLGKIVEALAHPKIYDPNVHLVKKLLLMANTNPNESIANQDAWRVLTTAIRHGDVDVIRWLLNIYRPRVTLETPTDLIAQIPDPIKRRSIHILFFNYGWRLPSI